MPIKVVSFDIFQTLVDVNRRIPYIWTGILGRAYTPEKAEKGVRALFGVLPAVLNRAATAGSFSTVREIYLECALSIIGSNGFDVTPETIVDNLFLQHALSPPYDDVAACMESLYGRYQVILSSDADHAMIDDLIRIFRHEKAFLSEDLKCYKGGPDGRFFARIVEALGVRPDEIIHIGDTAGDVAGAHRAGIVSCWLNRDSIAWNHPILPDYTIHSLSELDEILL